MSKPEELIMSEKDANRLHVIKKVEEKGLLQRTAAKLLGITERQIRRIMTRYREEGAKGILHRLRGKISKRRRSEKETQEILKHCQGEYKGFGPTFAAEKLMERDGIKISAEALRKILLKEGLWIRKRSRKAHRKWRERKAHFGEMTQMDGSHHDWLEGRGPKMVLMSYIDDATGECYGRFYPYEGTQPAMDSFRRYVKKYGLPQCMYFDRHSTYKNNNAEPTIEEQLNDQEPLSEFARALHEMGVRFIHANSPEAKGRIERSFNTHQDRLIKEMRLANIKTIGEANLFLEQVYWKKHNGKFAIEASHPADLHRKFYSKSALERALCKRTPHVLRNDRTVVHAKQWYQVESSTIAKTVTVEERYDGKLFIVDKDRPLRFKEISKPKKEKCLVKGRFKPCGHKPAENNPFNTYAFPDLKNQQHQKDWEENYIVRLVQNF